MPKRCGDDFGEDWDGGRLFGRSCLCVCRGMGLDLEVL